MPNRPLIPALVLTLTLPAVASAAPPSTGTGKAPAAAPAAGTAAKAPAILFSEMDANRDSRITRAEWKGNEVSFAQHDANGDGVLAGPEVAVPAAPAGGTGASGAQEGVRDRGRLERVFKSLDDNKDGRLSSTEFQARKKFERLDKNRDKFVSRDEFLKQ